MKRKEIDLHYKTPSTIVIVVKEILTFENMYSEPESFGEYSDYDSAKAAHPDAIPSVYLKNLWFS